MKHHILKIDSPYQSEGNWYKGNTHLHIKEGNRSIDEIIAIYRKMDYAFLVFTDHNFIVSAEPYSSNDFICVNGHETDCVVGINVNRRDDRKDADEQDGWIRRIQPAIDDIVKNGGIAQLAHPVPTFGDWKEHIERIDSLKDYKLIEIYNHRTGNYDGNILREATYKYALDLWDHLLSHGKRIWGVAADDYHRYSCEVGGGWIVCQADSLSKESIIKAIRNGAFYSSQGPEISAVGVRGNQIFIECLQEYVITFFSNEGKVEEVTGNTATYTVTGAEKYIRIECRDVRYGKYAWSNPFFVF